MPPHSKPSNIGIRAVAWKHYTRSSRTMVGYKASTVKPAMTSKQIDAEIIKIRQQIASLESVESPDEQRRRNV